MRRNRSKFFDKPNSKMEYKEFVAQVFLLCMFAQKQVKIVVCSSDSLNQSRTLNGHSIPVKDVYLYLVFFVKKRVGVMFGKIIVRC